MKLFLFRFVVILLIVSFTRAMEVKENRAHYDRARDCFTQQPLSLVHFTSKQIASNWASSFDSINGETVDNFAKTFNAQLERLPKELHPLVERQFLIEAGIQGYVSCYKSKKNEGCPATSIYEIHKKNKQLRLIRSCSDSLNNLEIFEFDSIISDCTLSPNKQYVLLALNDNSFELIDLIKKKRTQLAPQSNSPALFNAVRFLNDETFVSCSTVSGNNSIIEWKINDSNLKKIREESFDGNIQFVSEACKDFLLFIDEKNILWGCKKNKEGKIIQRITELASKNDLFDAQISADKRTLIIDHPYNSGLYLITIFDDSLKFIKKISLASIKNNFSKTTLSYYRGIISYWQQELLPDNRFDSQLISFDCESEAILNTFYDQIGLYYPLLNQPLNAILATVACANSNDRNSLERLKSSQFIKHLPENYQKQILYNIDVKKVEYAKKLTL